MGATIHGEGQIPRAALWFTARWAGLLVLALAAAAAVAVLS